MTVLDIQIVKVLYNFVFFNFLKFEEISYMNLDVPER